MELKLCPFCGGKAKESPGYYDGWNEYNYPRVVCENFIKEECKAIMYTGKVSAVEGWNIRYK